MVALITAWHWRPVCAPVIISTVSAPWSVAAPTVTQHPPREPNRALTCTYRFRQCPEDAGPVRIRTDSEQNRPCSDADCRQPLVPAPDIRLALDTEHGWPLSAGATHLSPPLSGGTNQALTQHTAWNEIRR